MPKHGIFEYNHIFTRQQYEVKLPWYGIKVPGYSNYAAGSNKLFFIRAYGSMLQCIIRRISIG